MEAMKNNDKQPTFIITCLVCGYRSRRNWYKDADALRRQHQNRWAKWHHNVLVLAVTPTKQGRKK